MNEVDRTRRWNLTKWKRMMEMTTEKSTPRKPYKYELIKIEKNKQIKKKERESTALRNHVMLRLKYGDKRDGAATTIQRKFRNVMKDLKEIRKKYAERQAKEVNNLMANFLKPKLKRSRTNDFNNKIPVKRTKRVLPKQKKRVLPKQKKRSS